MIHQVVVAQLAAARQAPTRQEPRCPGGGRKPEAEGHWSRRQARSARSNTTAALHGPVPRDYSQRTKKMKAALKYVLDRVNNGRVAVVDWHHRTFDQGRPRRLNLIVADNFTTVVLSRDNINEWLGPQHSDCSPDLRRSAQHLRRGYRAVRCLEGRLRSSSRRRSRQKRRPDFMVAVHKPAHDIILKPVVSEKSYAPSDMGQYTFVVAPNANKVDQAGNEEIRSR